MSIESIPLGCRTCPFILPYIEDIVRLEARQITPEIREQLIRERGLSAEDVDLMDAENNLELEQSQQALSEAKRRTIGCIGARIIDLDPSTQSSEGMVIICQSPVEDNPVEE